MTNFLQITSDEELAEAVSLLKVPILRLTLSRKTSETNQEAFGFAPFIFRLLGRRVQAHHQQRCFGKRFAKARFFALQNHGVKLLRDGAYADARVLFEEQLKIFEHPFPLYNIACCEALAGNSLEALNFLEKSVAAGFTDAEHIENDSDLASLRNFDQFRSIINKLKSPATSSTSASSDSSSAQTCHGSPCGGRAHCGGRFRFFQLHHQAAKLMESGIPSDIASAKEILLHLLNFIQHPVTLYNIACCDALLGHSSSALEFLGKAVAAGYSNVDHLISDSDLRSLHEFPEFQAIVASLRQTPMEDSKSSSTTSSTSSLSGDAPVRVEIPTTTAGTRIPINFVGNATSASTSTLTPNNTAPSVSVPEPVSEEKVPEKKSEEFSPVRVLESMGFTNKQLNEQILQKTNGNVNAAVELLLQQNVGWF